METVISYFRDGLRLLLPGDNKAGLHNGQELLPDGTVDFPVAFQDPGPYVAVVTRRGITGTGVTVLEQRLSFIVSGPPAPRRSPPPPPPQQQAVTCIAELDLADPGFGGIEGVRIHGGGFIPAEPVTILEGDGIAAQTNADIFGFYSAHIGVARLLVPGQHVFHAHGAGSAGEPLRVKVS